MKNVIRPARNFLLLLLPLVFVAGIACAQTAPYERTFSSPVSDVERVVRVLRPTSSGRLPTVDGFVEPGDQPLERYQRGYYECTLQVVATPSGESSVHASAKITAWYNDPTPARSGYRVLVSNGRIENDFLDQIQQALASTSPAKSTGSQTGGLAPKAPPSGPASVNSGGLRPQSRIDSSTPEAEESSSNKNAAAGRTSSSPRQPATQPLPTPLPSGDTLDSLKLQREATEKRAQDLTADIKNFEDILHNQVRPVDLAIVKKGGAHIFTKPEETAQVLFAADAEDEFQVLELEGAWVHVKISGASRGWIRRSQLDLPADYASTTSQPADPASAAPTLFNVSRDETTTFGGSWEPLKGKKVQVVWVEPASPGASSTAKEKRAFAKSLFEKTYAKLNSSVAPVDGIVIVFDSADGGQIAATISSVKALADGSLPLAAFWQQSSLDPPESFQDSPKK